MPDGSTVMSPVLVVNNPQVASANVDKKIEHYVMLRDKKRAIEDQHKAQLARFNELMFRIEAELLKVMNQTGLNSLKGPHGTAYKSLHTSATVRDREAFLGFVREHGAWDLIESRVSKAAAFATIKDTKRPIPGVETSSEVVCNIRRAGEKAGSNSEGDAA